MNFLKFRIDFKIFRKIVFIGFFDLIIELSCGIVVLFFNLSFIKYIGENVFIYYSVINYINILVFMIMMGII